MPCLLIVFGLFVPRVVLALLWLFTTYLSSAYETQLWPFLGFLFLPYSTLAYAIAINQGGGVTGIWMVLVVVGVLLDFGILGGTARSRRTQVRD